METETKPAEQADAAAPDKPSVQGVRQITIVDAVGMWRRARQEEADLNCAAELAEAQALLKSEGKNDALRKAEATVASAELYRRAAHARASALACEAVVDMLLGGRAPIRRG